MDGGYGALSSSEKAKRKEKNESTVASKTISTVEGEDNSSASGGPSTGDIGANGSQRDEATNILAEKVQKKIEELGERLDIASKNINSVTESAEDDVKKLYEPRVVAIGPYYRKTENNNFRITDEHKLWCVEYIIGKNYKQDLGKFLGQIKEKEQKALEFYGGRYGEDCHATGMDPHSFLEMLLCDSCFILFALQLICVGGFRECHQRKPRRSKFLRGSLKLLPEVRRARYRRDIMQATDLIKTDLLLLHNQIPFLILEDIYNIQKKNIDQKVEVQNGGNKAVDSIRKFALRFFDTLGLGRNSGKGTKTVEVHHLLHFYYLSLSPGQPPVPITGETRRYMPSASALHCKSAVKFLKKEKAQSVLNITTCKRGEIQMPTLHVYDHTGILLHNLIAFERTLDAPNTYDVTAYVAFMGQIVKRAGDVELLQKSEVLENWLAGPTEVTKIFRKLQDAIDCTKTPGYLAKLYEDATDCYNCPLRNMYAEAKGRYCSSVWVSITVVAGVAISVLTLVQTIYAIIDFYRS